MHATAKVSGVAFGNIGDQRDGHHIRTHGFIALASAAGCRSCASLADRCVRDASVRQLTDSSFGDVCGLNTTSFPRAA